MLSIGPVSPRPRLVAQSSWLAAHAGLVDAYLGNACGSDKSIATRLSQLRTAVSLFVGKGLDPDPRAFEWSALRFEHVASLRAALIRKYDNPATARGIMHAVIGVCKAAWAEGSMPIEALERIRTVKRIPGSRRPLRRVLKDDELAALLAVCDADPRPDGVRDAAIVSLLYRTGLRRSEVVRLDVTDWDRRSGIVRVVGKGNKERRAYVPPKSKCADRIAKWIELRGKLPTRALFVAVKGERIHGWRLGGSGLWRMLRRREREAGVTITCLHDMRRTCATVLRARGAKLEEVQEILGHASPQTTALYFVQDEDHGGQVAALLDEEEP